MTIIIGDKSQGNKLITSSKREKILEPGQTYLEKGVRMIIDSKFKRSDLFQVISEKHVYNRETPEMWMQETGRAAEVVEVRFNVNGYYEWVCDISEAMNPDVAYVRILDGLNKLKQKLERRVS